MIEDLPDDTALAQIAIEHSGVSCRIISLTSLKEVTDYLSQPSATFEYSNLPALIILNPLFGPNKGFDILLVIRQHDRLQHVPVVMLSNSDAEVHIRRAYESGANAYIQKSIHLKQISERTRTTLLFWLTINIAPR